MASQDWIKSSEQVLAGRFEEQTGIHLDFQIIPSAQYFNVLRPSSSPDRASTSSSARPASRT
jgi:hypothetical protein